MRVAVVAPPYPMEECPAPPLGVTYVAAAFESAGAEVRIIDYIVSEYTPEKLKREIETFRPDVVGVTSVTLNFHVAADIVRNVKRHDDSIVTVMGGPHVSFDALNALNACPEIDLIVMGEGEGTIFDLVRCSMDRKEFGNIRGVAFRQDGRVVSTGWRKFIDDIDTIPLPARHLLPLSRYQALGYPVSIITSRGCPYPCIFCLGRKMVGKKVRRRATSLVVDEIEQILSYGLTRINIADDLFTSDRTKVRELCREIRRREIRFSWSAFARVDTVDRETLEHMRDAGCDSVSFGVESGDQGMLKRIRKGITPDLVRKAVKVCKDVGIIAHASFMVGLPGESWETLRATKEFAKSLDILYGYHFLTPFPGTTIREEIGKYDLEIMTDDWRLYDANSAIVRTSKLSPDDINMFVAEYDREITAFWESIVKDYREGKNSPEDNFRVEGHLRTLLVYKILSEDLIETCGVIPADSVKHAMCSAADLLCRRIADRTGADERLIQKTITHFIDSGYIKSRATYGNIIWFWTRNNRVD